MESEPNTPNVTIIALLSNLNAGDTLKINDSPTLKLKRTKTEGKTETITFTSENGVYKVHYEPQSLTHPIVWHNDEGTEHIRSIEPAPKTIISSQPAAQYIR